MTPATASPPVIVVVGGVDVAVVEFDALATLGCLRAASSDDLEIASSKS